MQREVIASPCNGVCAVDPGTDLCSGCFRTLDEISGWGAASDEERREVLKRASQRTIARGRSGKAARR